MANYTEFKSCLALAKWWAFFSRCSKIPERLLFHIPNASATSVQHRANNVRMGVRAGVPDYFLAVPRGIKHGLFVEMKKAKGRIYPEQIAFHQDLQAQGYSVAVCYSTAEAMAAIEFYLKQ